LLSPKLKINTVTGTSVADREGLSRIRIRNTELKIQTVVISSRKYNPGRDGYPVCRIPNHDFFHHGSRIQVSKNQWLLGPDPQR
jgi:hypothetical protein